MELLVLACTVALLALTIGLIGLCQWLLES
jgi:hypothetical protein